MNKWHIAAIGEQKSPGVSASIGGDFRWRSPRSAYKIARCVAGFSSELRARRIQSEIVMWFIAVEREWR